MSLSAGRLGGGYAASVAGALPAVQAVLDAAAPGAAGSRLVVVAGPPGVGKSSAVAGLLEVVPASLCVDKDTAAAGFVLEAARQQGASEDGAYGSRRYWERLRPLEYGGAVALACTNLVGARVVFLVGGWGPELACADLWPAFARAVAPARLDVLHLDPPDPVAWRARLAGRGSRADSPGFEAFAAAVTARPVWDGAIRIDSGRPRHRVVEAMARALA